MPSPSKHYWLVKQEPETYPWSQFVADGQTDWTGVRSYPARLHLRAMQVGDSVLYYHSVTSKEIVGLAEVVRTAFPDSTATEQEGKDWSAVSLRPVRTLAKPVSLATLRTDPAFVNLALIKQSRLSVLPVTEVEFRRILELSEAK